MNTENTLYAVLGVAADADAATIETAYAVRVQALHGDADALSLLRVAGCTLRDPVQRAAYDRRLAQRQATVVSAPVVVENFPVAPRAWSPLRLALIAAAGVAALLFLLPESPPPAPEITVAVPLPTAADALAAPSGSFAASEPAGAVATAAGAAAETPDIDGEGAPAVADAAQGLPRRGAKQAGFDAQYVAWSVFAIRQRNKSGSGVLIAPDRILTNCHVLAGAATEGMVVVHSLTGRRLRVEKYARLDGEDACLLFAPGAGGDAIAWGNSMTLRPGDTVHAMGHPGGEAAIVWSKGVFRLRTERGGEAFLISENYCRPGSSGGPLLDDEGRLVGIVTAVQRFEAKGGQPPRFGTCISVSEATARALLAKPLFPVALAPAQHLPN